MRRSHRALARLAFYTVLMIWLATVVPVVCEHGLTSPYVHARFGHGAIHVVLPVSAAAAPVASPAEGVPHDDAHDKLVQPALPHPHQTPGSAQVDGFAQVHGSAQVHVSRKDGGTPAPAPASPPGLGAHSAPPAHVHPAALSATVSPQPQFSGPLTLLSAGLLAPAQPLLAAPLLDTSPLFIYLPPGRLPDPPPERPPAV